MDPKKLAASLMAAAVVGGGAVKAASTLGAKKALVLNVQSAVLRDGVGVVETVCAEKEVSGMGAVGRCYTDALPATEAASQRAHFENESLARWGKHFAEGK